MALTFGPHNTRGVDYKDAMKNIERDLNRMIEMENAFKDAMINGDLETTKATIIEGKRLAQENPLATLALALKTNFADGRTLEQTQARARIELLKKHGEKRTAELFDACDAEPTLN
jgi:hypothetical protein